MSGGSKKQTIGYKYFAAIHMILCHGPIDYIKKILVDEDSELIEGNYPSGSHNINKPNLFGGEKKQGGISGTLTILDGSLEQERSEIVTTLQNNVSPEDEIPAYRGVASMFLSGGGVSFSLVGLRPTFQTRSGMYLGMNPYLKTWKTLVQRIKKKSDGSDQWYKEKAAIPSVSAAKDRVMFQVAIDSSGSMAGDRINLVKAQLNNLLDFFALYARDSNLDLSFLTWGGYAQTSILKRSATEEDLEEIREWINNISVGGGTDFRDAFRYSETFFLPNEIKNNAEKYMYFITDGEPDSPEIAEIAASENADMINKKGAWSSSPVVITGFNIDLDDITYTRMVVNNGVYVINSENSSGMVDAAQGSFKMAYWDMNPSHIIRECLVDKSWGNETPEHEIDDESFIKCADTLYREGFGLSIKWTQEGSVNEFIQEILRHINGVIYEEPKSGLITLRLIRDDYDIDSLPVLQESEIIEVSEFQKSTFSDLINQVTVTYTNVVNGTSGTVTVQDTGLVSAQGVKNSKSVKYVGFSNIENAGRAGMRDLKTYASPLISADITVIRSIGINLRQGDVFRWNWKKYGVENVVMRIVAISLGDSKDNSIILTCAEDIFSMPDSTITGFEPDVPAPSAIAEIDRAIAFEVPYLELVQIEGEDQVNRMLSESPEVGFYGVSVAKPLSGGASLNTELYLTSLVTGNFLIDSTVNFSPNFTLNKNLDRMENLIIIPTLEAHDFSLINIEEDLPVFAQIGNEIVSIYSITLIEDTNNTAIWFKRGVLDTVPSEHFEGDTCYIWDAHSGGSETKYAAGEEVTGRLVNQSISASTDVEDAMDLPVVFAGRAFRPYPPADVKINNSYYPELVKSPIRVTWSDRNRVQQTGGDYIGWYDGSVSIENGVKYEVVIEKFDENDELVSSELIELDQANEFIDPADAFFINIKLYSVRDGVKSFQDFEWKFKVDQEFSAPYDIKYTLGDGTDEPLTFGKPYKLKAEVKYD